MARILLGLTIQERMKDELLLLGIAAQVCFPEPGGPTKDDDLTERYRGSKPESSWLSRDVGSMPSSARSSTR